MRDAKEEVIKRLKEKRYYELSSLPCGRRRTLSLLISLSYDKKDAISWRAMEAIGILTSEIAKEAPGHVRNTVGRLLWMMRDESGGIGWSVPEILGEIVRNNPELCADIAPIIASFHEEKMLNAGVLWAVGRIGMLNDEFFDYAAPIAASYLESSDPLIRGYAAFACGSLSVMPSAKELEKLKTDKNVIPVYEDGELREKLIGEIASEAAEKLGKASYNGRKSALQTA
jgi:hypothetical protein